MDQIARTAEEFVDKNGSLLGRYRLMEPVLVAVLALVLNLAGNGRTGLWDRDEPRYAVAAREMSVRGDWIHPTFNAEPRYHKPILIYWLMRLSTAVGGDNPFGARLVSALAGTGTCLFVWALGRRMLGPRAGLIAALILGVSPIMVAESKLATTDATLTLWMVGCQFCLWELGRGPSRRAAAGFWMFLSLATLTKGPVGPGLLAIAGLMSWWWGWPAGTVLKRLNLRWGLLGFALVTAPWYVAIWITSQGEFYRFAVQTQIVQRIASGMEEHGGFPGYYLASSTLVFYPWVALLPAALLGAWRQRKSNTDIAFLLGWILGPLVVLECVRTKLVHYYLPSYPACALLAAWLVQAVSAEEVSLRRWPLGRLAMSLLGGIGITITVGLVAVMAVFPPGLRWPLAVLAVVCGIGTLVASLHFQRGAIERGALSLVATWGLFMLLVGGWLIPSAEPYRTSRRVGERLATLTAQTGIAPILMDYQEPGLIYAFGRPVPTVRDRAGLLGQLDRNDVVLTPATPPLVKVLREKHGLNVTQLEALNGFSLTKGMHHSLDLVIVRKGESASPLDDSAPRQASGLKKSAVK